MKEQKLANTPQKGMQDWLPSEFAIRSYIFKKWREVCLKFGYQEYLTPLLESAELYRAKSGEDVGGTELMVLIDRGGRELAIRPEMTPSVTRMVSKVYPSTPKPIRYFSIANFVRNEKPQRGRNREFWQLNYDVFGASTLVADIEVVQMAIEIMLAFNPPKDSFVVYVNNRKLINSFLTEIAQVPDAKQQQTVRLMDKFEKMSESDFTQALVELGLNELSVDAVLRYSKSEDAESLIANLPDLENSEGFKQTIQLLMTLVQLGYGDYVAFKPSLVRGFDYYDGIVFEVFDKSPANNRAMFGGGRYNGLSELFVKENFSAVGAAQGDETMRLFLEANGMLEQIVESAKQEVYYVPILEGSLTSDALALAKQLRAEGKFVLSGVDVESVGNALSLADKQNYSYVVILGLDENESGTYKVKDMNSGEEKVFEL